MTSKNKNRPAISHAVAIDRPPQKPGPGGPFRVKGINSHFEDIKLRSDSLVARIGGVILDATLSRTIEGASTLTITVLDRDGKLRRSDVVNEKSEISVDGLHFVLVGKTKTGHNLDLIFEDKQVNAMRVAPGAKKAYRDQTTRAEFILSMIREIKHPHIKFHSPQLHVEQPVASQPKTASSTDGPVSAGTGGGTTGKNGFNGNMTVKGAKANAEQLQVATDAMSVADEFNANRLSRIAMFCALTQENDMTASTNDGPFAFLDSTAAQFGVDKHDTKACAKVFLVTGINHPGGAIKYAAAHPDADPGFIAQWEEASAYPGLYSQWADEARKWLDAWTGESSGGSTTVTTTKKYTFERGEKETTWDASKRLADEVQWRLFCVAGTIFYMSEPQLYDQAPWMTIRESSPGVDAIDWEFDEGKKHTEITVTCRVKQWAAPPGTVVTVRGQGDMVDDDYIVSQIDTTMMGVAQKTATITLKKPSKALPEPAAETSTKTIGGTTTSSSSTGYADDMGDTSGTAKQVVDRVVNFAHDKLGFDVTPESVAAANAVHGPTVSGGRSDHQGPPATAWAADISNGTSTPEEAHLAAAIADAFGFSWDGAGLVDLEKDGWAMQLIHNTMEGGNHYTHVHFGLHKG